MSNEEQEKMSKIAEDIRAIKRWWPVFAACAAGLWFIVKVTMSATSMYDNDVAKKSDIQGLVKRVDILTHDINSLSASFGQYKTTDSTLSTRIDQVEKSLTAVKQKISFVTEVKKQGHVKLVPVNN
jgi:uncharacterized coiled-coil DUF342 family protein